MNKYILISALILAVFATSPISCPYHYVPTSLGCAKSCSGPSFANCPDVFPLLYNPSFCAVDSQGRWQSFTYACQACQAGYIAVRDGKCTCDIVGCPVGQKCVNGECVIENSCGFGKVSSPSGCILSCNSPQLKNCPNISNSLIYDPQFCGYRRSGEWISYSHICQACSSSDGIGVKSGKCTCEDLGCRSDQVCDQGYCEDVRPPTPQCRNNYECSPGYFCNGKICVDKCITTMCKNGQTCDKGKCIEVTQCPCSAGFSCVNKKCVPQDQCRSNSDCEYFEICNAGECFDRCIVTTCIQGQICLRGQCIRSAQCFTDQQCKSYEFCLAGKCTDKCAYIRCQEGYICKFGGCLPNNQCNSNGDCPTGFNCINGQCVDLCAGVNCGFAQECKAGKCNFIDTCRKACPHNQVCRLGQCVDPCIFVTCPVGSICRKGNCTNICQLSLCGPGLVCQNGNCIQNPDFCLNDLQCEADEVCKSGKCINKCQKIKCNKGEICVNGKCRPQIQICPVNQPANIQFCIQPRPDETTCPKVYYIRQPDPLYCGVLQDGTRVDFPRECQACKQKGIIYYFDVPCHDAPLVCDEDEKCQNYYCAHKQCSATKSCPFNWQTCINNKCVDRCDLLKCASCRFGQCGYQEPYGRCNSDSDCQDDWSCVGKKCVDKCLRKKCPYGHECWKGSCRKKI